MEQNKPLPNYQIAINEDANDLTGVHLVSWVIDPAVESTSVFLSKNESKEVKLSTYDEKQIMTSCVLRADFPIYRKDKDGTEYNIIFSKEEIFKIAKKFFQNKLIDQTSFEHNGFKLNDNVVVESWFAIEKPELDKGYQLGITDYNSQPMNSGSWFMSYYIPNKDLYQKLKAEKFAFSIEGLFNEVLIPENKLKNQNTMSKSLFKMVSDLISKMKTKEGKTVVIDDTGNASIEGKPITDGNIEFEDGSIAVIEKNLLQDIKQPVVVAETKETEVPVTVDQSTQTTETKETPAVEDEVAKLKSELEQLKTNLNVLTTTNTALTSEVERLSKLPAANPINTVPANVIDLSKMSTAERIAYNVMNMKN